MGKFLYNSVHGFELVKVNQFLNHMNSIMDVYLKLELLQHIFVNLTVKANLLKTRRELSVDFAN